MSTTTCVHCKGQLRVCSRSLATGTPRPFARKDFHDFDGECCAASTHRGAPCPSHTLTVDKCDRCAVEITRPLPNPGCDVFGKGTHHADGIPPQADADGQYWHVYFDLCSPCLVEWSQRRSVAWDSFLEAAPNRSASSHAEAA